MEGEKKECGEDSVQEVRFWDSGLEKDPFIIVDFDGVGRKQLNEKVCVEKGLIEYV